MSVFLRFSKKSIGSKFAIRQFSNRTTVPSQRNWDPKEIYPNKKGHVRVTGITLRDGHQSLNGGLHRIDLLEKAAALIDKIRPPTMPFPGHEEIGGGTTVDFPLRFKAENPFRNMERISSKLPNTPTSALIRADSLCGYNVNPRDVVDAFITRYGQCGIDIFRVFDAYNNVENHLAVSEAVHKNKKHYQAAITFTSHEDPTYFNPKWVGDMARAFSKLGAHSICIKDMAGISSPAIMKQWVAAIKDAVPELPVIIHCHYTTGFSPICYLQAIEAGASAIDCGISTLSGRSGHPAMEVFNHVLTELGYDLGWDPKQALDAMKPVADLYREYHPRYEFCEMKMAGTVDYRVFTQGIPGGQISIMRNELFASGYGHLFDKVIEQIQRVRTQVGGVALVTPTSEHVARQSIVNAMNGQDKTTAKSPLWSGYSEMLRGVMGRPPMKMEHDLQKRALKEWVDDIIKQYFKDDDAFMKELQSQTTNIVEYMWNFSLPIQNARDIKDLKDRIRELSEWDAKRFASQIQESKNETKDLESNNKSYNDKLEQQYTNLLRGQPDPTLLNKILKDLNLQKYIDNKKLKTEQAIEIIKGASFCTVCPSSIIPQNGMERARLEIEKLAVDKDFEIPPRNSTEFEEFAILQCMFRNAQNIALNYFINHKTNPKYLDKKFPPNFPFDREEDKHIKPKITPTMYPYHTKIPKDWSKKKDVIANWSESELKRTLNDEIALYHQTKQHLINIEKQNPENEYRKILKDRALTKTKQKISEIENSIKAKLKTSLYATRFHDSGYQINVEQSISENWKKIQQIQ